MCDEPAEIPIPCPPVLLGGVVEKIGSEAKPQKKGGVGKGVLKICIFLSLPDSDLISNKLIFPQVESVVPMLAHVIAG